MYSVFGCPMHYGVGDEGLIHSLDDLNHYCGNLNCTIFPELTLPEKDLKNLKYLNSVTATCTQIAGVCYDTLSRGEIPLFLGGDHSSVIGSISASGTYYQDLGLVWIDAHPDINTDATTITGNIHGMPVAALLGMGERRLAELFHSRPKLKPPHIVMLGLRDIDPPEAEFLKELQIKYYTYEEMERLGIEYCLNDCIRYLSHLEHIHISFDVDVMNPAYFPGVSVPVPEGLKEQEAFRLMDELMERLPVVSYDIVEFNSAHDKEHQTAEFVHKLICQILKHVLERG